MIIESVASPRATKLYELLRLRFAVPVRLLRLPRARSPETLEIFG